MNKTLGAGMMTLAMLSPEISNAKEKEVVVPENVKSCYQSIYSAILSGNTSEAKILEYVNPDNVLINMRNPINNHLRGKVIKSTRRFITFLLKKINEEGGDYEAEDVEFTKYVEYSTKIYLEGKIGKYRFKLYLEPGGECKVLNFIVAGIKGMRDGIPKL